MSTAPEQEASMLLMAYGRPEVRAQAYVNLLSFLRFWDERAPCPAIHVYTDRSEDFAPLSPWLSTHFLDAAQIREWAQPSGFWHLAKVHLLDQMLKETKAPLLFMDADIYWLADPRPLLERITNTSVLMERNEGSIAERRGNLSKKLDRRFRRNTVEWRGEQRSLSVHTPIYNSGLIGLHPAHQSLLPEVAELTTALFQTFRKHTAEQLAYNYVLADHQIRIHTAAGFLWHYWPNQQLVVPQMLDFVQQHRSQSLEQQFEAVAQLIQRLEELPRRTPRPLPKRLEAAARGAWLDLLHHLSI